MEQGEWLDLGALECRADKLTWVDADSSPGVSLLVAYEECVERYSPVDGTLDLMPKYERCRLIGAETERDDTALSPFAAGRAINQLIAEELKGNPAVKPRVDDRTEIRDVVNQEP